MKRKNLFGLSLLSTFVILVAGRDVLYELWLQKKPEPFSFAFWLCSIVTLLSFFWILFNGEFPSMIEKLKSRKILVPTLILGLMCSIIYISTFVVINQIGAGVFNMIDWGIAPLITVFIGIFYYKNNVSYPRLILSITFYLLGTFGLYYSQSNKNWAPILIVGLLSPIFTAISFPVQKWLMQEDGGGLTRAQVTFARFLPASFAVLITCIVLKGHLPQVENPLGVLITVSVFGFVPLILLCLALFTQELARFAVWQFGIPALAFFGTLYAHPELSTALPILSASIILLSIIIMELPFKKRESD